MDSLNHFSRLCFKPALGLLLIRVVTGLIFINHGWMKFGNIEGVTSFFASIGLPAFMVTIVALVEVVGGAMLIFGVLTRAAGVALGITALFAGILVTVPKSGIAGSEFEFLLAATSFGLALIGSGSYRLFHMFEHDKETLPSKPMH